jgi:hypothetical protein
MSKLPPGPVRGIVLFTGLALGICLAAASIVGFLVLVLP